MRRFQGVLLGLLVACVTIDISAICMAIVTNNGDAPTYAFFLMIAWCIIWAVIGYKYWDKLLDG